MSRSSFTWAPAAAERISRAVFRSGIRRVLIAFLRAACSLPDRSGLEWREGCPGQGGKPKDPTARPAARDGGGGETPRVGSRSYDSLRRRADAVDRILWNAARRLALLVVAALG